MTIDVKALLADAEARQASDIFIVAGLPLSFRSRIPRLS